MNEQPIFILGASRSGNTLFRMILSSHPKICIPPESQFLHYLDPVFHSMSSDRPERLFKKLSSDEKFSDWNIDDNTLIQYIKETIDSEYAAFIAGIYQLYLKQVDRANAQWGDKNPMYIFKINRILELFPKAWIILLVREPLSIYGSLKRVDFFGRDRKIADNDYYRRIKSVAEAIMVYQHSPNVVIVNYADFVTNPEKNTKILINRLGYDYEPAMLDFHSNKSFLEEMLQSKVKFHENLSKPISSSFVRPDNYNLEQSEITQIETKMAKELKVIRSFIKNNPAL